MTKVKIVERVESLEEYSEEVKATLPNKLDKREIDNTPILGSDGLVTSDGIFKALDKKQDNLIIDYQLSNTSLNPIANSTVATELNAVKNSITYVSNALYKDRGIKMFTSSSTFIVPSNVNSIKVICVGGGGGSNLKGGGNGNSGGNTSFGNLVIAYGGSGGGYPDWGGYKGIGGSFRPIETGIGFKGEDGTSEGAYSLSWDGKIEIYGRGSRNYGGAGGTAIAVVNNLTPGETVSIIVGSGGYGDAASGSSGVCIVEW